MFIGIIRILVKALSSNKKIILFLFVFSFSATKYKFILEIFYVLSVTLHAIRQFGGTDRGAIIHVDNADARGGVSISREQGNDGSPGGENNNSQPVEIRRKKNFGYRTDLQLLPEPRRVPQPLNI